MNSILPEARTRPATVADSDLVHNLYLCTPGYFDIISIPIPTRAEVEMELSTAAGDPRRHTELILLPSDLDDLEAGLDDCVSGRRVVGYLDYKVDYPEAGDATVNLLLIQEGLQSHGIGRRCVEDLEVRLKGSVRRVLASIYGQNLRARRFWNSLGYHFAIDAKPVLDWYAKELD